MSVPAIEARIRRLRGLSFRPAEARGWGEGSYCITGFSAEEVLGGATTSRPDDRVHRDDRARAAQSAVADRHCHKAVRFVGWLRAMDTGRCE